MLKRKTTGPVVRLGAYSKPLVNLRAPVNANNHRARLYGCILARESNRGRPKCADPCCSACNGPLGAVMAAIAGAVVRAIHSDDDEPEPEPAQLN